jgi:hypothetical protein
LFFPIKEIDEKIEKYLLFYFFIYFSLFNFVYSDPQIILTIERENKINEIYRYYRTQNTISDDTIIYF